MRLMRQIGRMWVGLAVFVAGVAMGQVVAPVNPGYVWTNEVVTFTNVVLNSATPIALSKDAHSAAVATVVRWNQQYGLSQATNRYSIRDVMACWAWHWGERQAAVEWRAEQEAKKDVVDIRSRLGTATEEQIQQIKGVLGM